MDNIIPFKKPPEVEPHCSFCNKPKSLVRNLIANADDTKHICNECINKSMERLNESL